MNCPLLSSLLVSLLTSALAVYGQQPAGEKAWLGVAMPSLGVNTSESIYKAGEFPPMPVPASQGREC